MCVWGCIFVTVIYPSNLTIRLTLSYPNFPGREYERDYLQYEFISVGRLINNTFNSWRGVLFQGSPYWQPISVAELVLSFNI